MRFGVLLGLALGACSVPPYSGGTGEPPSIDAPGDALGPDEDGDGIANAEDTCPNLANPDQHDVDGDGVGDLCDPHPYLTDSSMFYAFDDAGLDTLEDAMASIQGGALVMASTTDPNVAWATKAAFGDYTMWVRFRIDLLVQGATTEIDVRGLHSLGDSTTQIPGPDCQLEVDSQNERTQLGAIDDGELGNAGYDKPLEQGQEWLVVQTYTPGSTAAVMSCQFSRSGLTPVIESNMGPSRSRGEVGLSVTGATIAVESIYVAGFH